MNYTKEQLFEVLDKHIEREKGLQEPVELLIESMVVKEMLSSVLVVCSAVNRLEYMIRRVIMIFIFDCSLEIMTRLEMIWIRILEKNSGSYSKGQSL